ncbi:MAG TPA: hypothetical protein VFQ40_06585 [Actinomycetota bacterium]|nr:hypothetical protein [Actinomycetota bacterium]
MFARYFVELPLPPASVEDVLSSDPEAWLRPIAQRANHRGDELLADVGIGERRRVERTVQLRLGTPIRAATKTVVPFSWEALGPTRGLFPTLDADLEIAPLGPARTQVAISARYAPPLGAVGRMLDRAVLHRVAEATIKDFLDQVGQAVVEATERDAVPARPAG